ncbi:MAG: ABC transporter permease [Clostridia bacterium]|nr:ABC transporter permease [Clostridia bacterium]
MYAVVVLCFLSLCIWQRIAEKKGKKTTFGEIIDIFTDYRFLLNQLVGKEFKVKYRRSYLGMAWSLVNPFLMMIVVSAVFSFVFRFNIEKFPAYLILGQIMFNFFSEATQFSLLSIIGSGQLIKKVYMPKYIFPLSRTIFSFYNFLITFIPAIIVLAYYRVGLNASLLFLPLFLLYYFIFTLGVGFILATAEVFLRDVQHLYGVLLLALGYVTPIFYPADALSSKMQFVLNFNPLFHYVKYFRNVMFYHNCPTIEENIICLGIALAALIIGIVFFNKKQKHFILYI